MPVPVVVLGKRENGDMITVSCSHRPPFLLYFLSRNTFLPSSSQRVEGLHAPLVSAHALAKDIGDIAVMERGKRWVFWRGGIGDVWEGLEDAGCQVVLSPSGDAVFAVHSTGIRRAELDNKASSLHWYSVNDRLGEGGGDTVVVTARGATVECSAAPEEDDEDKKAPRRSFRIVSSGWSHAATRDVDGIVEWRCVL